ncbi:Endoplasmic reticulum aminopeptidase 2, partial [Frankliniella fusca]
MLAPAALGSPLRPVGPPLPAAQGLPHGLAHGLRGRTQGDASWRLPGDAHPLHYDVHIAPELDGLYFIASVDITLQIDQTIEKGKALKMHADGSFLFSKCTLDDEEVQFVPSRDGKDFINFLPTNQLEQNSQHVLHCDYSGKIFKDDKGFYLSTYKLKSGLGAVPVKLGVTQFEMTFARRAFPCFDEPGYRATFALTITHRIQQSAISNTPPRLILPVNETHAQTQFEKTPAMPVYTLAWLVSQMPNVSSADGTFHTYAPPAYITKTALSQSVGPQVLSGMEEYTGIPYALDKMDQVAVPDFNFGAMENWGLVTY